jgi:type VI secretion system protein ImpL
MNFLQNFLAMATGYAAPLTRLVRRRWLRTLIWALAVCLVVFFYGDALRLRHWQPFDSDTARFYACAAILVLWALYNVVMAVRDRQANASMISAITAEGQGPSRSDLSAQEVEQMRSRLQEAMTQLRRTVGGRRGYVYQLPWYIMIGPPGSGKTTALLNSGLKFPLADSLGREPLHGVGGTRNCDWWFTEDAILLDTAGRYTTQDSDPELDRQGWSGFLNLMKTYRPLQPINGVIVALSLEDVATRDPQERLANAQSIRQRLAELTRAFGSRFPIYILLTKADLIAGFVQFFDAYSRTDREQVWGMTFPLDDGKAGTTSAASTFDAEFDLLLTRMNAILLERLQQETDIQRRGLIFGFPLQVATLKEPIRDIIEEIFSTSKFDQRPLLRGIYLASGTQAGAPIDRLMQAMASTFGMEMPRQAAFAGREKSYFLTRLLDSVIFAEANVVAADPRVRRRMANTRWIAGGIAAVLVFGLLGTWALAFTQNQKLVAATDRHIAQYRREVAAVPTRNVSDTDFAAIVPPLNMLRDGPAELRAHAHSIPVHAGMDQSAKLQSQYAGVYARALDNLLLPRLLVILQKQMRNGRDDDFDFKVSALKVYLGLGGQGPLDSDFTRKWMQAEWSVLYPGEQNAVLRQDLDSHLAALLRQPIQPIALDGALIGQVQRQVQKTPLAARAYALLRDGQEAARLPAWTVEDKAGAAVDRAFTRVSNAPLTAGIPGFYTRDGYLTVFLPGLHAAVSAVSKEQWAYGSAAGAGQSEDVIAAQTTALYRGDFNARWTALLSDLRIQKLVDLQQSVLVLTALAGPDSVMMKLLDAIVHDTDLSPPAGDPKDAEVTRLRALIATTGQADTAEQPFAALRAAMQGQNGGPSQIGDLMRTVNTLYEQVSRAGNSPGGVMSVTETEGGLNDANQKLISQSRLVPPPVDIWLSDLSASVSSVTSGTARSAISQSWNASGQHFCTQVTRGRYPFAHNASNDISVDDFNKLFGPGGTMDAFFSQNLRQFVNTNRHPWRWQYNSVQGVSSAFLQQFEHADAIRQAFFSGGNASFHYEITPDRLDPNANAMTLAIGGQVITYAHGPVRPTTLVWPAPGDGGARLSVEPSQGGAITEPGVWAPFRLIDAGSQDDRGPDQVTVDYAIGPHTMSFVVKSDAALNPFTLRDIRVFRCPGAL